MYVLFLLFQILGAVILGFGIWILADKTSFIAVLRKTVFHLPSFSKLALFLNWLYSGAVFDHGVV